MNDPRVPEMGCRNGTPRARTRAKCTRLRADKEARDALERPRAQKPKEAETGREARPNSKAKGAQPEHKVGGHPCE